MKKFKRWLKYRRVRALVERAARNAFYMQHWGRAHNLNDRLDRLKGIPSKFRLRRYQHWKRAFAADAGYQGHWQFDSYTLS